MSGTDLTLRLGQQVAAGGDTLGRLPDGRVVFCEGGLPGEDVRVAVVRQRRDFAQTRVVAVESASPERVEPPCPHVTAGCGGCQWQHMALDAQLRHKAEVVADSWRRLAHLELPPGPEPRAVRSDGYRTTLRLAVDDQGRPSYRKRHGHDTVAVGTCPVAHPRLQDLLAGVRLRPAPPAPGRGAAAEVGLRVGVAGGERLVIPAGGAVVVQAPVDAVVVGPRAPGPGAAFHEDAGGRRWRVSADAFFQSGPDAADLLAAAVADAAGSLDASDTLVDLYAGVGLLGGVVAARTGCRLVAVESSPTAADDAVANLADLGEVRALAVDAWEPCPADVVVADPSRSGLGRPGVAAAVATGARRIVLVSCDPASGARDAALLHQAGYRPASAAVLDLFPHTFHVETVVAFDREGAP